MILSTKRFFWLKLKDDFFDDDTISFIEEQENGVHYINFYLKLCLKSIKTNGRLYRLVGESLIPYDVKSLSKLTNTPVDTVRTSMELFQRIGLVQILDSGEIYMSQIDEMMGSETDKARLMRESRARRSLGNNVTGMLPDGYSNKEKDKDEDQDGETDGNQDEKKEADKPRKRVSRTSYGEYGWVKLSDEEHTRLINEYGETEVQRAITYIDEYAQSTGNKNKYKDWNLVVRKCIRDRWGVNGGNNGTHDVQRNYDPSKLNVTRL